MATVWGLTLLRKANLGQRLMWNEAVNTAFHQKVCPPMNKVHQNCKIETCQLEPLTPKPQTWTQKTSYSYLQITTGDYISKSVAGKEGTTICTCLLQHLIIIQQIQLANQDGVCCRPPNTSTFWGWSPNPRTALRFDFVLGLRATFGGCLTVCDEGTNFYSLICFL